MNLLDHVSITFIDTETTHLDVRKSEILSICIWTEHNGSKEVKRWSTKIKPKRIEDADSVALKINGYNEEEWKDAPYFEDVAHIIEEKLRWGPIVGHNINFDMRHIKAAFRRYAPKDDRRFGYPLIDTVALSWLFMPTERQNLNACREYLDIDTSRAHDCENDVEDCRHVFWHIIDKVYKD